MKRLPDKIQFESRSEIEHIITVLQAGLDSKAKLKDCDREDAEELIDLLDVIHMEW